MSGKPAYLSPRALGSFVVVPTNLQLQVLKHIFSTLSVVLLPIVESGLPSGMPTTIAAFLPSTLGFIKLTSALLFSTLFQFSANAVAIYLKPCNSSTINAQVLDSIQCIDIIFAMVSLD